VLRREAISLDAPATLAPAQCVASGNTRDREVNMFPRHINPVQWQQALEHARQVCARIFRDGGRPTDAVLAFGLAAPEPGVDWSSVVDRIAQALCAPSMRRAA
jgi:hypothetical protein